jgi:hypothetical protein
MTDIPAATRSVIAGMWLKQWYFSVVSTLTLALTLVGFSDNLFTNIGQPSNSDPKFIAHGLFCLAWMIVFAAQVNLARRGSFRLHRKLGVAGMLIAIGVVFSTTYVFVMVWKGWDAMGVLARGNRILLPGFAVCVLLAWLHRRRGDWHKRLVYVATLCMLEPVLSRAFDPLVVSWMEPLFPVFTERMGDLGFLSLPRCGLGWVLSVAVRV